MWRITFPAALHGLCHVGQHSHKHSCIWIADSLPLQSVCMLGICCLPSGLLTACHIPLQVPATAVLERPEAVPV